MTLCSFLICAWGLPQCCRLGECPKIVTPYPSALSRFSLPDAGALSDRHVIRSRSPLSVAPLMGCRLGEGLRLNCLKRWGDGMAARTPQDGAALLIMTGAGYEQRTIPAGFAKLTWPVPTYELQVNPNLVQNEGF